MFAHPYPTDLLPVPIIHMRTILLDALSALAISLVCRASTGLKPATSSSSNIYSVAASNILQPLAFWASDRLICNYGLEFMYKSRQAASNSRTILVPNSLEAVSTPSCIDLWTTMFLYLGLHGLLNCSLDNNKG